MEDWAEIVKTVRKKEKLTQKEFAKKMGVSCVAVSHWEQGNFKPRMKQRRKLKKMLDEDEDRDIEIIKFIYVLVDNISDKKLNDERMHIWDMKTNKNCGTLKEYIVERMETLLGARVVFGEDTKG